MGLSAEAAGESKHRAGADRSRVSGLELLLTLKPREQPPSAFLVEVLHFFDREFDCAHAEKLTHGEEVEQTLTNEFIL